MRFFQLAVALLVTITVAAESRHVDEHGRVTDMWDLEESVQGEPVEVAQELASRHGADGSDLRVEATRQSLAGTHVFLREYLGGYEILNGGFTATTDLTGRASSFHDRTAISHDMTLEIREEDAGSRALDSVEDASRVLESRLVGWKHEDGVARLAWLVVAQRPSGEWRFLVDAGSGVVFHAEPMYYTASGRIFDPSPVTSLNNQNLRDDDDDATAVPEAGYVETELQGLTAGATLAGPWIVVTEIDDPLSQHASPEESLHFDRSEDQFEDVMVYAHIDRSQRYIQSLGFVGASGVVAYAIPVDPHGVNGADNSFYLFTTRGRGRLSFGDGGVDDAEDADIVMHEYGHAIHDSIVPGGFSGTSASQGRAMGEAFGDYWAFSSGYAANLASGADKYCIGDWDARCGTGASTRCAYPADALCLRRVDGTKTMDDYLLVGSFGTEHLNGEIWSSALREIFEDAVAMSGTDEGRRLADRTILEGQFGLPPGPTFKTAAIRLIDADRRLNNGLLSASICSAMTLRKIMLESDCETGLNGELTLVQSPSRSMSIPDNSPAGVSSTITIADPRVIEKIFVAVDIRHPRRGELRISIEGPDGTKVTIQTESGDSGEDIIATYGLDTEPSQSLASFIGLSAAGTWTLTVSDHLGGGVGELLTWSLLTQLEGDGPLEQRVKTGEARLQIPIAGNVSGASGTKFVSDVRIFNRGLSSTEVTLIYTPSGSDGSSVYSAIVVLLMPGQVVALDDVVRTSFRTAGTGSVEVRGSVDDIVVTSRIYNDQPGGTFGQFLVATSLDSAVGLDDSPLHVIQLRNTSEFRSNLGVAEIAGGNGEVEVRLLDQKGTTISTELLAILPYGHTQIPLLGGPGGTEVEVARAEVRVLSGDARVNVYGSAVDNLSGDAVYTAGVRRPRITNRLVVPAVIHADGALDTNWRSDLWVLNAGEGAITLKLVFRAAEGGAEIESAVTLQGGELVLLGDVVVETFGANGTGSLIIEGEALDDIIASSRAWNDAATGSFGQHIEAQGETVVASMGETLNGIHVDSDDTFRANVGVTEVGGGDAIVRIFLLDSAGTEVFSMDVPLEPGENRQANLAGAGAPSVSNARIRVDVLSGTGAVVGYVSVIDNRTGDAVYVGLRKDD